MAMNSDAHKFCIECITIGVVLLVYGFIASLNADDFLSEHYLGCFYNNGTQKEATKRSGPLKKENQTFDHCIQHCKGSNTSYSYARLQNGSYCECVDESGLQVSDSLCYKSCGESSQLCGGTIHTFFATYALYSICPIGTYGSKCLKVCHCKRGSLCNRKNGSCPNGCHGNYTGTSCDVLKSFEEQYIGCYKDNSTNDNTRAMSRADKNHDDEKGPMSLKLCTDLCSSKNYSFSAGQYHFQCFCGESYDRHGTLSETNCSSKCTNSNEKCGGGNANSVYHTCPSGYYGHNCSKVCNCQTGRCFTRNKTCQVGGCIPGWTGDGCSLRDCNLNNGGCDAGELCVTIEPIVNRTISVCRCPDGYGRATTGGNCTDIDECKEFPRICGPPAAFCSNVNGGYACRCPIGADVNNSHCKIDAVSQHYVGCFYENVTLWNMQNISIVDSADSCIYHCLTSNHSYARLLNNTKCLCGNESGIQLQEPACNIACKNSSGQNCSGTLHDQLPAYDLYTVCPIGFYGVECKSSCSCKGRIPCDRLSGRCLEQCQENDTGGKSKGDGTVDRGSNVAAVIVPILLVMAIVPIVVVLYIYRDRLSRKTNSGMNSVGMTSSKCSPEPDGPPVYEVVSTTKPITTDTLPDFIKSKLSAPNRLQDEFKSVPQQTKDVCSAGKNPSLKQKNRFKNIIPYNRNRVMLKKLGNNVLTDYINASHIATFNPSDKFIATQGPKPETINDFWRLICEQNVGIIVMITNLIENQKTKCEKYWPDVGSSALFGEISVETQSEQHWGDYIARTLLVESDEKSFSVVQWHFIPWPDHGVPSDVNSFLTFRKRVRQGMTPGKSVVVHCSAGAGRTGCFIAIDHLLEQERSEHGVDIYGCLQHLRKMRCQMVQTFDQYQFIHRAVLLSVTIGETSIPIGKYAARLRELNTSTSGKGMCSLDIQHQMLNESREELSGINYSRVLSKSSNASKISEMDPAFTWGWKRRDAFITLDPPSTQTVEDFYELCSDYKCTVIIVIDTDKVLDKTVFPSSTKDISLKQQTITCGGSQKQDFGISYKISERKASDDTYANFGQFDIYANTTSTEGYGNGVGAGKVCMHVLHVTESLGNDTIGFQSLVSLHRNLKQLNVETEEGSTVVMSRSGYELIGYCLAALNAFDMSADEKEVDVFQIVQEIMKSRSQFEFSLSAFKELHSTIAQFIQASA